MGKLWLGLILAGGLIGCSQRPCRGVVLKKPLLKKEEVFKDSSEIKPPAETVFIYKYDGSMQCKMGKPIPLKDMKQQLNGIKIYSAKNKPDGLMHITVCGSPTGQANVYEIEKTDFETAKARGFQLWTFDER